MHGDLLLVCVNTQVPYIEVTLMSGPASMVKLQVQQQSLFWGKESFFFFSVPFDIFLMTYHEKKKKNN